MADDAELDIQKIRPGILLRRLPSNLYSNYVFLLVPLYELPHFQWSGQISPFDVVFVLEVKNKTGLCFDVKVMFAFGKGNGIGWCINTTTARWALVSDLDEK